MFAGSRKTSLHQFRLPKTAKHLRSWFLQHHTASIRFHTEQILRQTYVSHLRTKLSSHVFKITSRMKNKMNGLKTHMNVNVNVQQIFVKFWQYKRIRNCYSHHRSNEISQTSPNYSSHLEISFRTTNNFRKIFQEFSKMNFERVIMET